MDINELLPKYQPEMHSRKTTLYKAVLDIVYKNHRKTQTDDFFYPLMDENDVLAVYVDMKNSVLGVSAGIKSFYVNVRRVQYDIFADKMELIDHKTCQVNLATFFIDNYNGNLESFIAKQCLDEYKSRNDIHKDEDSYLE